MQVIFFLMLTAVAINGFSLILSIIFRVGNYFLNNLLQLVETLALFYFFSKILLHKYIKKILFYTGILFVGYWIYSLFAIGSNTAYFDSCSNFENISMLLLSLLYFYEQVISINTPFIYKEPYFWIVSAYFIYFAGVFFLFLYIPYLSNVEVGNYYWLNSVFTIIRSFLLSIAMISKPDNNNFNTSFNVSPKNKR